MNTSLQSMKDVLSVIVLAFVALAIFIAGAIGLSRYIEKKPAACNVADVKLFGDLVYHPGETLGIPGDDADATASEDVRQEIEAADADPSVKAILFQVDSDGGDPVAGEDIAAALRHTSKPTVALVGDAGDSAAYWAATGAQTIFASADSSLADIGVTESYLDQTRQDEDNGLTFIPLTAGKYKDTGNPDAPLTDEEKALLQRDLNVTMQNFIDSVAKNRGLSVASVTAIADGSSMGGAMALQDGLIDKIGNIYDVRDYLKGKIGHAAVICGD
jgi:signal peptide peptidase SppA